MLLQLQERSNTALKISGAFIATGIFSLVYSILFEMQVAAFIGLGLTFWGAVLALTKNGRYIDSGLLDTTARSTYSTIDRIFNDLKYTGQAYYLPASPRDVTLPDYLKNLKEPVAYISENFNGKPSIDDLAAGKFLAAQGQGFFISSPGAGIMSQVEKQLKLDLSKVNMNELCELLPKCLTENLNLARNAEMTLIPDGAHFKAVGIIYDSFHNSETKPRSINMLGCPVVSAVACALAKSSTKTVMIKEQQLLPGNSVNVIFAFSG